MGGGDGGQGARDLLLLGWGVYKFDKLVNIRY